MDVTVRPISLDELEGFARAASISFGFDYTAEFLENERLVFEAERSAVAFEGEAIIGGSMTASLRLGVPGATVPAAGLTSVSVLPTHRRRGILRALMQAHLDDARARGEPVSALWASEAAIYGRFGYGTATWGSRFQLDRPHGSFARPHRPGGRTRVIEGDEILKALPSVYGMVQPGQPGMIEWSPEWWRYLTADQERHRDGFSRRVFVLHEGEEPDGYLVYRFKHDWSEGVAGGTVEVEDLVAATPESYADLWRFCLDMDLAGRIQGDHFRSDEPLLYLLADPRRLRLSVGDGLWVRPLEVPGALDARRYAVEDRLRLRVTDPLYSWNEGVYELVGGPDGAECRLTSGEPDLALGVGDLGAAYLGGTRLRNLQFAGRVVEETPGAIARADAMFSWDPPPWSPHVF